MENLPNEIIYKIVSYLGCKDWISLKITNTKYYYFLGNKDRYNKYSTVIPYLKKYNGYYLIPKWSIPKNHLNGIKLVWCWDCSTLVSGYNITNHQKRCPKNEPLKLCRYGSHHRYGLCNCSNEFAKCRYCKELILKTEIIFHDKECKNTLDKCHKCSKKIFRKNMANHWKQDHLKKNEYNNKIDFLIFYSRCRY